MNSRTLQQHDRRRFRQFQLKHVLGLTAGVAISAAVLAPQLRKFDEARQTQIAIQALVLFVIIVAAMVYLLFQRYQAEKKAGLLVERFERNQSRWTHWLVTSGLVALYLASIWGQHRAAGGQRNSIVPGSPMLLLVTVNFVIVRSWWKLDPMGIEVCEHGLVLGGLATRRWDEISRYTWSGQPTRQLNLFLEQRYVMNIGVDVSFVERLDSHLRNNL